MNLRDREIEFKSSEAYFPFEETGIKFNTVRKIDLEDYRFLYLIAMMVTKQYCILGEYIIITSDLSKYIILGNHKKKIFSLGLYVIWKHPEN